VCHTRKCDLTKDETVATSAQKLILECVTQYVGLIIPEEEQWCQVPTAVSQISRSHLRFPSCPPVFRQDLEPSVILPVYSFAFFFSFFSFFFSVLRLELRAYTLSPSTSPFVRWAFFEIGSHELFAQAGFEPWSSWSLPTEQLGLQAWATGAWLSIPFSKED
jgi:hypothetical protein